MTGCLAAVLAQGLAYATADLILYNGNIITMDSLNPSAQAIAIQGKWIMAVGTDAQILSLKGAATHLLDLRGLTVLPGLIDMHSHRMYDQGWHNGGLDSVLARVQEAAQEGYTTVCEMFTDLGYLNGLSQLAEAELLQARINVCLPFNTNCNDTWNIWNLYPYTQKKDTLMRVIGVKIFADGGTCNTCGCLTIPYVGGRCRETCGHLFRSQAEMDSIVDTILAAGYPIAMHAIGDSAIGVGLHAFQQALGGGGNSLRSRLEHLNVMRQDLADQMAQLGIGASIQFSWTNPLWLAQYDSVYPPELKDWLFAWRRLADRGIPVLGSNDIPYAVTTHPLKSISYLATRRERPTDTIPDWAVGDELTVLEGLKAMTLTNAWFAFEEEVKGSLTPGKLADLIVVLENPLAVDPFDVRYLNVVLTIMDGVVRHNRLQGVGGWQAQVSGVSSTLLGVAAQSDQIGWAVGDNGVILHTVNRGAEWQNVGAGLEEIHFHEIEPISADICLAAGYKSSPPTTYIYRTTDAGGSWSNVFEQANGFVNNITMSTPARGTAVGDPVGGFWVVLKTTDGGNTWNSISTPPVAQEGEYSYYSSVSWIDSLHGWFGTNQSRAFSSSDGGNNWSFVNLSSVQNIVALDFNQNSVGLAGGIFSLARSTNGGQIWQSLTTPGSGGHIRALLAEGNRFWLLRGRSTFVSTDTGVTWELRESLSSVLQDISLVQQGNNSLSGWVVGDSGRIVRYQEGVALCEAIPGDANASTNLTLADVISIVNYVFNKPVCLPLPTCWLSGLLCRGDWNGSGTVTLADAIRGVNYIFNKPGGPWNALSIGVCCLP